MILSNFEKIAWNIKDLWAKNWFSKHCLALFRYSRWCEKNNFSLDNSWSKSYQFINFDRDHVEIYNEHIPEQKRTQTSSVLYRETCRGNRNCSGIHFCNCITIAPIHTHPLPRNICLRPRLHASSVCILIYTPTHLSAVCYSQVFNCF